jgi:hypothetical protein
MQQRSEDGREFWLLCRTSTIVVGTIRCNMLLQRSGHSQV